MTLTTCAWRGNFLHNAYRTTCINWRLPFSVNLLCLFASWRFQEPVFAKQLNLILGPGTQCCWNANFSLLAGSTEPSSLWDSQRLTPILFANCVIIGPWDGKTMDIATESAQNWQNGNIRAENLFYLQFRSNTLQQSYNRQRVQMVIRMRNRSIPICVLSFGLRIQTWESSP